jgi:predicted permease
MARLGEAWRRLVFFFRRRQMDRDLAEEMRDHLARKAEKNIAAGMTADEARCTALRQLGNPTLQQEHSRASWGFPALEHLLQDLHYGLRGLRRAPGFTTVAILTLALGIGATTAIFSIVNTIVLRPLPFKDSERLVHVWTKTPMFPSFNLGVSRPDFDDIKAQAHSFENLVQYRETAMTLGGAGEAEQLRCFAVTTGFLDVFGIRPLLGRDIELDDEQAKSGRVVLIGYGLWQSRFGGARKVIGERITLDQEPYTIVGVLPQEADYSLLAPLNLSASERQNRQSWMSFVYAKLKPGTRLRSAQAELDGIAARLRAQYPKTDAGIRLDAVLLQGETVENAKTALLVLLGAVSFLLLIACANVGNLILARGTQRQREISVRAALGASRGRIVRQLLAESVLVALLGGAAGMVVAVFVVDGFKAFAPGDVPRLRELRIEPMIAWFGLVISSFAGIVCGLAPALQTSRTDLVFALKDRGAASASPGTHRSRLRNVLVISEVALALVLLTGSALMVQSLARTLKVDPGFRTDHLLTAELTLSKTRYSSDEARQAFLRRMLDELNARPQLGRAAMSDYATLDSMQAITSFDPRTLGIDEKPTTLLFKSVDPGYFQTMGVPPISGRFFDDHDSLGSTRVVIINESLARHYFPGQNPIGRTLQGGSKPEDLRQIVGIVADVHDVNLRERPKPQLYWPLLQRQKLGSVHVYVRTQSDDPMQIASALQQSVWAVDKDMPVTHIQSMAAIISKSVAQPRFRTWLLSAFAVAGLALTLIGIYGVISYSVGQRNQEIGIRVALGAQPESILRLILGQGLRLALLGAVAGLIGAFALTRLIASELFGVKPADPATLVATVLLMFLVASLASYIPARRATRVDPVIALRQE